MARSPRTHVQGAYYHIMLRGNNCNEIFFSTEDRLYFYQLIEEAKMRFNFLVHAFCLMTNHVHILLQVGEVSISKIMQNICFRYTQKINKQYARVGHLFQGRFKSKLVDSDEYLLQLVRYIHLNPVEAHLVDKAGEYLWSSHRVYLSFASLSWLTTNDILQFFGENNSNSIKHYLEFIEDDVLACSKPHEIKVKRHEKCTIKFDENDNSFALQIKKEDVISFVCSYYDINESKLHLRNKSHFFSKLRALIAWLVKEFNVATISSIAYYFKRDISVFIRTIHRLEKTDEGRNELVKIKNALIKSKS